MKVKEDNCNFGMLELLLDAIGILSEKYVKNEANARCLCFLCEYPTFYRAIYKEITCLQKKWAFKDLQRTKFGRNGNL